MRNVLPTKERTTIVTPKSLLDRLQYHTLRHGESQTDFIVRAIVNQLEKEGDFEIRSILEEEKENAVNL